MSDKEPTPDTPEPDAAPAAAAAPEAAAAPADEVVASRPDYAALDDNPTGPASISLGQLQDVQVRVTAELGRTQLPIGEILQLGTGSVIELNRSVSSPVDLMVDDVLVATGEVVVIDDRFAIRIQDVESRNRQSA